MSSLNGIGSIFDRQSEQEPSQQQWDYDLLQRPTLHSPGCPNPYASPDQCFYCFQAAQAITLADPATPSIDAQEQYRSHELGQGRLYNPTREWTSFSWNEQAVSRTEATESPLLEQTSTLTSQATTFTANGGLLNPTDTTYAQALQYPYMNFNPCYVESAPGIGLSQQADFPDARSQTVHSRPPSQTDEQDLHRRTVRSQRPRSPIQYRSTHELSFSDALALGNLMETTHTRESMISEAPSLPTPEATTSVGQLLGIPPDEGYNSAIMSQGTPSTRSTNSRRSERRKGNALRVWDETFSFICRFEDCGVTFPGAPGLKRHEDRTHKAKDQRPYSCSSCIQKFHDRKDCTRHKWTHLPVADRKKVSCSYPSCPKVYSRGDNMLKHVRADHKSDSGVEISRQTSCSSSNSRPAY